ncbi:DUF4239 domain-containing protein [Mycobacterium spongiae]|uniref:DUF4239 domain-containing protein n=1 Tax=Mycobacterium spongiae TaxID=886343 RepID=A0A975K187_9MYCO|nr:DUF4239 domain-containing protein [Mycobacterium spongiae]
MSSIPLWLLLLGLLILIVGGALVIQTYVRHRFPQIKQDAHNDVTRFAYGVVGFVYAFFIGFVVSALWSHIKTEDAQARIEGAGGVQLARDVNAFDEVDRDRIRKSLLEYERAALAEWPLAARGRSLPEADKALQRLYAAYSEVRPRNDIQKAFLTTSFSNLNSISQARTERVIQARIDTGMPWSIWVVILLTSGLVLACAIIYGVEQSRMHYPLVATVAVLVAANLFLVLELSHPFIGRFATSSQPLHHVVEVLSTPPT